MFQIFITVDPFEGEPTFLRVCYFSSHLKSNIRRGKHREIDLLIPIHQGKANLHSPLALSCRSKASEAFGTVLQEQSIRSARTHLSLIASVKPLGFPKAWSKGFNSLSFLFQGPTHGMFNQIYKLCFSIIHKLARVELTTLLR